MAHHFGHFETQENVIEYFSTIKPSKIESLCSARLLSGGVTNQVYRCVLPNNTASVIPDIFILKYYPPFAGSRSIPFCQDRYFVEKEALTQVYSISSLTTVKVPRIYFADDENKVLLIEDIGERCVSLMAYLSRASNLPTLISPTQVATRLSNFLQCLYRVELGGLSSLFENKAAYTVLNAYFVDGFQQRLKNLGISEEFTEWIEASQPWVVPAVHPVLTFGDLWPNSVYISDDGSTIWLIDWELSRFGTIINDLRQMVSNLYLMEQAIKSDVFSIDVVKEFRKELVDRLAASPERPLLGKQELVPVLEYIAGIMTNQFWGYDGEAAACVLRNASKEVGALLEQNRKRTVN